MKSHIAGFLLFLSLFTATAIAQDKNPYFSLYSEKTFRPQEKMSVDITTNNVDALEFRLYKVQDPEKFLHNLKDLHAFGGVGNRTPQERIDELTWIERFHNWKRTLWWRIRKFFRGQLDDNARDVLREKQAETVRGAPVTDVTRFAVVPLLNDKQLVARWRQQMPPRFVSASEKLPIDPQPSGLYLLEATDGVKKAYTILFVSRFAVITRTGPGTVMAYCVDRETGAPVKDALVHIWANSKLQDSGTTVTTGLVEKNITVKDPESFWIIARSGDDIAVATPYSWMLQSGAEEKWMGYVYTDRPVYRPGHTVHVKAIVRERKGDERLVPQGSVTVNITDLENKNTVSKSLRFDSTGSVSLDFELAKDSKLGFYQINLQGEKTTVSGNFYVEEYKKPEYKVWVKTEKLHVRQGDPIHATIEARYYFGEPVAGAKVKYSILKRRHWEWGNEDESGDENAGTSEDSPSGDGESNFYGGEKESELEGKLDKEGRLIIDLPTSADPQHHDMDVYIAATVTDEAGRDVVGYRTVLASYGDFQIHLQPESYVFTTGKTPVIRLQITDYDDHKVQSKFVVDLMQTRSYGRSETILRSVDGATDAQDNARVELPVDASGFYKVRAKATDSHGREIIAESWIWVATEGLSWFNSSRRIQVIADRKTYKVGDLAKLMILAGKKDTYALITIEGHTIQNRQVLHIEGESTVVDIPITRSMQPNMHVGVVFLKENEIYQANKNVKVPAVERTLKLEIKPSKEQFIPGESAIWKVTTKDFTGNPVSADVSFGIVDEALYGVREDTSGNIVDAFYPQIYNEFSVDSSLTYHFHGESGTRSPKLMSAALLNRRRSKLAQVKPENLVQPKIRKAFPDTSYWNAHVHTDTSGNATVSMNFPDSLTTWRATARAITSDTRAGSAISRVLVRKNLIVRLAAPRFFRQGDEVVVAVIVHNYLQTTKEATVSLEPTGLKTLTGASTKITIPSRDEAKVEYRLKAEDIGTVKLLAKALTNEESDAMEIELPVLPFGVRQKVQQNGVITSENENKRTDLTFSGQSDPRTHSLTIKTSPSIAGAMLQALNYLTDFPYGCTEQTMSSFLPNIIVTQTMKDLNLKSDVDPKLLKEKVNAGLERLYGFQHEDGGWGWWKEDESTVFMTAYVVSGLSQAKAAGYEIQSDNLGKARTWLQNTLHEHKNMLPDLRAYVTYALVLSDTKDPDMLNDIWGRRSDLSNQGLAFAGLALHQAGDARAAEITKLLLSKVSENSTEAFWTSKYDSLLEFEYQDYAETTAHALKLVSEVDPQNPILPKAAFWLIEHRDQGYYWTTTKQTAMVIYGLTSYLKNSHELQANFNAEILLNGKSIGRRTFTPADVSNGQSWSLTVDAIQLKPDTNSVEVRKVGAGRLYWSAQADYYSNDRKLYQSGTMELNVARDYFRLVPETHDGKITYKYEPLTGSAQAGDVIAVRLSVTGSPWKYLMLEDPIPSGTEYVSHTELYPLSSPPNWWGEWWGRREYHDDRLTIFHTYFERHVEYVYLLKVVRPGVFKISPTLVEPMYQPSVFATSDSKTLEAKQ